MKKELYPYSLEDENKCLYCREPDSVLHTFVQYHFTQDFYTKLVDWFNRKFNCTFSPKSHEILFGIVINISENSIVKFNYCLLFAKYYLYYQKMYSKRWNIDEFVIKVEQKLIIDSRLKRKILVWDASDPNAFYPYFMLNYSDYVSKIMLDL